jgi:hypothetical protein
VRFGIPAMFLFVVLPATFVAHAMARANRRLWVTIGPSGVQLRSGLFKHLRLAVDLEHITAESITEIDRPRTFTSGWYSTAGRLRVTTRTGPALRLSLADETELVISMDDPDEPAGVLNTLLDQRSMPSAVLVTRKSPTC